MFHLKRKWHKNFNFNERFQLAFGAYWDWEREGPECHCFYDPLTRLEILIAIGNKRTSNNKVKSNGFDCHLLYTLSIQLLFGVALRIELFILLKLSVIIVISFIFRSFSSSFFLSSAIHLNRHRGYIRLYLECELSSSI